MASLLVLGSGPKIENLLGSIPNPRISGSTHSDD